MKRLLLIAVSGAFAVQPAHLAGQLFYNGVPGPVEYLNFVSGSGVNGGYGVQVGPYVGHFQGDPASAQFSIYCVDYNHFAKDQWVNVTALGPVGNLANTRLNSYGTYQKAAYLSSLFDNPGLSATQQGGIHAAIWYLTSGVTVGDATLRNYYLGLANTNGGSFNTDGWYVLSPTPLTQLNQYGRDVSGQEFLMRSVPEPATFLLLTSGLLMLAAFSRKRLSDTRGQDV